MRMVSVRLPLLGWKEPGNGRYQGPRLLIYKMIVMERKRIAVEDFPYLKYDRRAELEMAHLVKSEGWCLTLNPRRSTLAGIHILMFPVVFQAL